MAIFTVCQILLHH